MNQCPKRAATRGAYRNKASNYSIPLFTLSSLSDLDSERCGSSGLLRLVGLIRGSGLLFIEALSIDFRGCHVTTDPNYRTIWLLTHLLTPTTLQDIILRPQTKDRPRPRFIITIQRLLCLSQR